MSAVPVSSESPRAGDLFTPSADTYVALGALASRLEADYASVLARRIFPVDEYGRPIPGEPSNAFGDLAYWDIDFAPDGKTIIGVDFNAARALWHHRPPVDIEPLDDSPDVVAEPPHVGHIWRTPKLALAADSRNQGHRPQRASHAWNAPTRPTRNAQSDPRGWLHD